MIPQKYSPREHQPLITNHILDNKRCAAWADMGTGKSIATLTAIDILFLSGTIKPPVLIIGTLRVAKNVWPKEVDKWVHTKHLKVRPIIGDELHRRAALLDFEAHIFTINYENIPWLVEYLGDEWPFVMVVADESTKLKGFRLNQGTQRAKALSKIAWSKVERFVELTGTPASNGIKDLWGQMWFLDKGFRLGRSFTSFSDRWFETSYDGYSIIPKKHAQKEVEEKLQDICISIKAEDYFDVKKPVMNVVPITLPPLAMKNYKEMEKNMFTKLRGLHGLEGDELEAFNAAGKTMKCLQLANGAAYVDNDNKEWNIVHNEKIKALEDIIEEAAGMPVFVAYHFKSDLDRLLKAFPQGKYLDDKQQTEDDWNEGKIPVLFAHPASAGHGLNLQYGSNILAFFSVNWNLEEHDQFRARIGPIRQLQSGFNRPVYEHYILAQGTVDELVMQRLKDKREIQDILLEAMKKRK